MKRLFTIFLILTPFSLAFASNGSVNYSEGTDALVDIVVWLQEWRLYTVYTLDVVAAIVGTIGALQVFYKVNTGDPSMEKDIIMIIGAVVFVLAFHVAIPALFDSIEVF